MSNNPQPFPNPSSRMTDENGALTTPWRLFFVAIWNRTGASIGANFAALNGSSEEIFRAAAPREPYDVVNLSSQSQAILVETKRAEAAETKNAQAISENAQAISQNSIAISAETKRAETVEATLAPLISPILTTPSWESYTVETLPSAPTLGMKAVVTDAKSPTYRAPVVGAGTITAEVFFDGVHWLT